MRLIDGLKNLESEFKPMLRLSVPVVLAELGWVTMGIIDTMMVGRVGPEAIGGVSLGSITFFSVAIFGMGLLLGLDTLVSQAFGAGHLQDCHSTLFQGVYLSFFLTIPLSLLVLLFIPLLNAWGLNPAVLKQAIPYLKAIVWSLLPLLLYATFRRYLQAMNQVKPIMFALISANLVNAVGNWILIFGHLGAPAMGAEGAGWATCFSRIYMAFALLAAIWAYDRRTGSGLWASDKSLDMRRTVRLIQLGLPASLQITMEVGVFGAATALAGKLTPIALASHHIALNAASFTFMVPLGIASAGAVRVGQAIGRADPRAASRSGWTALCLGTCFMSAAGLAFLTIPHQILRIFTTNSVVINSGVTLLYVAAVFQLFDGLQVVATGILRGAGDTRTPMICNLIGHWLLGLPIGYILCFILNWGVFGLWMGLSVGLILVGAVLLLVWSRKVIQLNREFSWIKNAHK